MSTAATACWHCGEPLPSAPVIYARVAGEPRSVCCHGCRAAAEWIEQLGLADYYRLRTHPADKPTADRMQSEDALEAWQRTELSRHVVRDLGAGCCETMLLIEGVRCAACAWLIERALSALQGVKSVQINAASRRARVIWNSETTLPRILRCVARAGYRASPIDAQALNDVRRRESRDALKRLLVAGLAAMQAMMFAAVIYLSDAGSLDASTQALFRWLGCLAATPVVFYSARPFFAGALRSIEAHRLGMDVLVAAAIALIYGVSFFEAWHGGGDVYFDSISMFVFFLLAGRYLEMRARHHAGDLTDALARLTPPYADRHSSDGQLERVGVHELRRGDHVHVAEGGLVPADGVLQSERCRVDESLLSGESAPVSKRCGDLLIAGSVLEDGPVEMCVERVGADTALAGMATLVNRAQTQRPKLVCTGERAAARFVVRVLALAAVTVTAWSFVDPARALEAALAVLVVSCPCAFALAVPAAITRAIAELAQRGVLIIKSDAISALAEATHIVFDKTGTMTEPQLAFAEVETSERASRDTALRLAASLARESRHPVARALVAAYDGPLECVTDASSHAASGIEGVVGGRRLRLGRSAFVRGPQSHDDEVVWLADDAGVLAAFRIGERLRPGTRAAIAALKAQGLGVSIASGDAATKVAAIAALVDVSEWRARQLPADKLQLLTELRAAGARVVAVGDGINDAPVLAGADVAVAIAGAAELAQASSDIVLAGGRIEALPTARAIARQTLQVLQQNQRWALLYNLTAVPLAALGLVPPWLAAIGMSASSLCVVLNALRIGRCVPASEPTMASATIARGVQSP